MKLKRIISSLLIFAVALGMVGCAEKEEVEEDGSAAGVAVQVETISAETISAENVVSGKVVAESETAVYVMTTAQCKEVYVEEGQSVRAGDILCKLDMSTVVEPLNDSQISYLSAEASYNDQKAILDKQVALYEKTYYDTVALYNIGAASQMEVQSAELQYLSSKTQRDATLAQLAANMQSYQSGYVQMELAMESVDQNGNVIAPVSGVISSLSASAGGTVSSTYPVATISGAEQMKVSVSVSEALVPRIAVGDTVGVTISSLERSFDAVIYSIDRVPSLQTKLFTVTITVPAEQSGLMSGMFADVSFRTETAENAIVVPAEAILTSNGTQYVYVVEENAAKRIDVVTGLTGSGVTEVTEGLEEGMALVTVGQQYLSDGDAVRIVEG